MRLYRRGEASTGHLPCNAKGDEGAVSSYSILFQQTAQAVDFRISESVIQTPETRINGPGQQTENFFSALFYCDTL